MKPRPVEIVIRLETDVALEGVRRYYRQHSPGKCIRVDVFPIKRLKATGGGAG